MVILSNAGKQNTIQPIPWSRVLFEKLIVVQSLKKIPILPMETECSLPSSQVSGCGF
jgi:hypothetical protein